MILDDTIVAIATPPGRSALAVIRLSGARALEIGAALVHPFPSAPRVATRARVSDAQGRLLDDVIAVAYHGPASFTGEDAVELTCHGGVIVPASIAAACVARGARPAEPGEFTRRAVLNGKLDILQAEAVGDLIDATSTAAQRVALAQLEGGLSRRINALRDAILELEALCAYDIDFPEEDEGPVPATRILDAAGRVVSDIERLLDTAPMGEIVRSGAVVVIAGAPNVGKSSLFNALLGARRAIVTAIPGTTRDAIEAVTEAEGWPVRLVDTAGIRDSSDEVERLGIETSREYLERAHVVLACGDSVESLRQAVRAVQAILGAASRTAAVVAVRTKADLSGRGTGEREGEPAAVRVSASTGEGLQALAQAIAGALAASRGDITLDAPIVTRERQRAGLKRAREELILFRDAWTSDALPASVAAVHLRDATRELEEIIGAVDVEDVLDRLFRTFCVGK